MRTHTVGGLETITANDICAGRLKAILALFFALSRFKQASKQKAGVSTKNQPQPQLLYPQQQQPVNAATDMTNR